MIKFLLLGAVALAAYLFWRRRAKRRQLAYLDSYPYVRWLDQRLAKRRPELSPGQRARVLDALRDYFHLCHMAERRMVAMPSQVVDDAWHEFILFTRHYDEFCRAAFGRFLHHTPAEAMRSPTQASAGIRRAWRLACAREQIDPQKPQRLPRLFALDAELLIAGGFVYQLDCLAARQGGGTGSGYCASHIGCTGGCAGDAGSVSGDSDSAGGNADGGGSSDGGSGGCGGGGCGGGGD